MDRQPDETPAPDCPPDRPLDWVRLGAGALAAFAAGIVAGPMLSSHLFAPGPAAAPPVLEPSVVERAAEPAGAALGSLALGLLPARAEPVDLLLPLPIDPSALLLAALTAGGTGPDGTAGEPEPDAPRPAPPVVEMLSEAARAATGREAARIAGIAARHALLPGIGAGARPAAELQPLVLAVPQRSAPPAPAPEPPAPEPPSHAAGGDFTVAGSGTSFHRLGAAPRGPEARAVHDRLPAGFAAASSVDGRKRMFIQVVLPLVLRANGSVLEERRRIVLLAGRAADGQAPTAQEAAWLAGVAARYGIPSAAGPEPDFAALLRRVDMVPPSLALAQAAEESGWGGSRFARTGNALFGQVTWGGDGLLQRTRRPESALRIRTFDRLIDGTLAYVHNLNTHRAYAGFRAARAAQRRAGRLPDGHALADGLLAYSDRGRAYVASLRTIIRANRLDRLDHMHPERFDDGGTARFAP